MKVIMMMFDTLNRRFLSPYGCDDTLTPNFQRLSERAVTFENCYVGSMPCMPARRELHTGRYNFLHRGWGPLEPYDDSMPELLQKAGIYTHLVSDHGHYWEDGGATYHQRYNTWENVRGQEGDKWKADIRYMREHCKIPEFSMPQQDAVNRAHMVKEELQPQPQVFAHAKEFLDKNRKEDNWFLQIETFDPHEPYFTDQRYKEPYMKGDSDPRDWPTYGPVTEDAATVEHYRNTYRALVTMCDTYLGRLLDYMDRYGMWEDTMLIVNTDHGFLLGEHDWWAKCCQPFYNEIAHIPLFVWDPRLKLQGQRRSQLVQTIDIPATILDFFGHPLPEDMQGVPLGPVMERDEAVRQAGLYGMHGSQVNVTDGRYVYMRAAATEHNTPLYDYVQLPTHMRSLFSVEELRTASLREPFSFTKGTPLLKIESRGFFDAKSRKEAYRKYAGDAAGRMVEKTDEVCRTMLFDLREDPYQNRPIHDPETEERMIRLMVELMKENDAPSEQYERLGLTGYLANR